MAGGSVLGVMQQHNPTEAADQMLTAIEFHDSTLSAIRLVGGDVVLDLSPAYLHCWTKDGGAWVGTGWNQPASVRISSGALEQGQVAEPVTISDDAITIDGLPYRKLLPVSRRMEGAVRIELILENAVSIVCVGNAVEASLHGKRTFVEALPADFAPKDDTA